MKLPKLFATIQAGLADLTHRKKPTKTYLSHHYQVALPGKASGRASSRKKRLARFKMLLQLRRAGGLDGYQAPSRRKRRAVRVTALAVAGLALSIFAVAGGWRMVLGSLQTISLFRVSELVVDGPATLSPEKLRELTGITLHRTSLLGLDVAKVEATLAAQPWVARATVERDWPSTVNIGIIPHVAVALALDSADGGGQLQYIDRQGKAFMAVATGAEVDFPVITGLAGIANAADRQQAMAEALALLKHVGGNNPNLPAQSLSEIHVEPDGSLVVYLVDHPFPIFFGQNDIYKKYFRLVQVLKALYKKQDGQEAIARVAYIQMDYMNDKVLVAQRESD